MATVWAAVRSTSGGRTDQVVLKILLPEVRRDEKKRRMFMEEAKLATQLFHPYIVRVHEIEQLEHHDFLVMERIWGQDLRTLIDDSVEANRTIPWRIAVRLTSMIAQALHSANTQTDELGRPLQVIHRDIKPGNILYTAGGEVKIIDFGIAKAATSDLKTKTGTVKGTIAYMSPEQVRAKQLSIRSDLFSLSVVLYELCTGTRPFLGESITALMLSVLSDEPVPPIKLRSEMPSELSNFIIKNLDKEADNRSHNALAYCKELEKFLLDDQESVSIEALQRYFSVVFPRTYHEKQKATPAYLKPLSNYSPNEITSQDQLPTGDDLSAKTLRSDPNIAEIIAAAAASRNNLPAAQGRTLRETQSHNNLYSETVRSNPQDLKAALDTGDTLKQSTAEHQRAHLRPRGSHPTPHPRPGVPGPYPPQGRPPSGSYLPWWHSKTAQAMIGTVAFLFVILIGLLAYLVLKPPPKKGKKGLLGFFMGEVMKKYRGKVSGKEVAKLVGKYANP